MAITLYQYPGGDGLGSISPPCLRVDMALRWLGTDFERRDLRRGGEVAKVSRSGRLPVLEIDGDRFIESTRILDELERRFDVPWKVDTESEAAHLRLWEYAVNDYYYWCGFYLRWVDPEIRARFLDVLLRNAGGVTNFMVRRLFVPRQQQRAKRHGVGARDRADILVEIERGIGLLATDLKGGPFLLGRDRPARADLTVFSHFAQAGFGDSMPEVMRLVEAGDGIKPYLQRICDTVGGKRPRWLR